MTHYDWPEWDEDCNQKVVTREEMEHHGEKQVRRLRPDRSTKPTQREHITRSWV